MRTVVEQALWAPHIAAALFGLFGLLSLVLAVLGVYGVMTYIVLQRTTEIGVRMALGAHSIDVLRMVLRQSIQLAAAGVVVGVCVALALTRLVADLLFDVSPHDARNLPYRGSSACRDGCRAAGHPGVARSAHRSGSGVAAAIASPNAF